MMLGMSDVGCCDFKTDFIKLVWGGFILDVGVSGQPVGCMWGSPVGDMMGPPIGGVGCVGMWGLYDVGDIGCGASSTSKHNTLRELSYLVSN